MSFLELGGGPFSAYWADAAVAGGFPPGQLYITYSLTVVLYSLFAAKFGAADGKPSATAIYMVGKFGLLALLASVFAMVEVLAMLCASIWSHPHIAAKISFGINGLVVLATYVLMCLWLWKSVYWEVELNPSASR